jgi:hypothetical protein
MVGRAARAPNGRKRSTPKLAAMPEQQFEVE